MNGLSACWLVFLALIKNISYVRPASFTLPDRQLSATEGSCVEIKCSGTTRVNDNAAAAAYWFWIMNGDWSGGEYIGTVIYSTNEEERPVDKNFAGRVTYTGSPSSTWNSYVPKLCSISICNLEISDSGNYAFRFLGKNDRFLTNPGVVLKVTKNPCPITFEKPSAVIRSGTVTLTCSTLSSCPSNPEIRGLEQIRPSPTSSLLQTDENRKTATVSFTANWQHDGKEFSCQATNNKDKHLIRNVSLTVEYPPQGTSAKISTENIVEGNSVTLTCSAEGRPVPTFTWYKNGFKVIGQEAERTIPSIKETQNGEYHCKATNKHGTEESNPVTINVKYKPEVEVTSSVYTVAQGGTVTLTCVLKRANPEPDRYAWFLNGSPIEQSQGQTNRYVIAKVEPEHRGKYRCSATNTVGTGTSTEREIKVKYGPQNTKISIGRDDKEVKLGESLTFTCNTDANPAPHTFFWSRQYKESSKQTSQRKLQTTSHGNTLNFYGVQRGDEACYTCNATNAVNTGKDSEPLCIEVLYAPTKPTLSMLREGREGQLFTINCTVESSPPSAFTLMRAPKSNPSSPAVYNKHLYYHQSPNTVQYTFNLTSDNTGFYTCRAENSIGSATSNRVELVVKYRPKRVTVTAEPSLIVNENKSLNLYCKAESNPPVTSVTWTKMTKGRSEKLGSSPRITLKPVSPSDSGLYSCTASNEIGAGNSPQAEVKVKYAPKHTNITRAAEKQQPDGTSYVTLSCSSESYPPIQHYSWYKVNSKGNHVKVRDHKELTVYSDEPGGYYCIAKNEINQRLSETVHLFDRSWMKVLFIVLFVVIVLIISVAILVHGCKRKKSAHRGTTNTTSCLGFPGGWNGAGMNRMNNPASADPFRSRDDLLADQPRCPKARRCQPRPDSTPESTVSCVYSTVNLPSGAQGPSAQKPRGHTQDHSLNYASLHFGNKKMNKQGKAAEDVYAIVSKQKSPNKNDEMLEDYENISAARTGFPNPLNYDTDTSEDEVEINYSKVSFKAKPGHQRARRDSSSSEEDTQYSQVKI